MYGLFFELVLLCRLKRQLEEQFTPNYPLVVTRASYAESTAGTLVNNYK